MNSNLCWPLVRLAVLLGVFLVQSSEGATYQEFVNKHIDPKGPGTTHIDGYCNRVMVQRKMTTPKCKPWNTFFIAKGVDLQKVCHRGGWTWRGNLRDSKRRFNQIVCTHTGKHSEDGGCKYTGRREHTRLRLGCANKLPVHFEKRL